MTGDKAGGRIATVGTFDGVHRGHAHLLEQLKEHAHRLGLTPLVLALSPHPLATLRPGHEPAMLTLPEQRAELISSLSGIADVRLLRLAATDFALRGAEFLARLQRDYGVEAFMTGFNNHIGSDRADAAALAAGPMPVIAAGALEGCEASSSAIRTLLAEGRIADAEALLGHRYTYRGHVVHGKKLGRTIGFPTANIGAFAPRQLLPKAGVYAVEATVDGERHAAMANIGVRPTVDAAGAPTTFEVNIFDFEEDIYGHTIDVDFVARIRDERRFGSADELAAQLKADALAVRAHLS